MQEELRSGSGHIVYKDYITALDKYLIPFFGSYDVANINAKALVDFGKWRTEQLGRKAHHSTINTHNTCTVFKLNNPAFSILKKPRAHCVCFLDALPVAICITCPTRLCNCMLLSVQCGC
jgi:hypothetical protein